MFYLFKKTITCFKKCYSLDKYLLKEKNILWKSILTNALKCSKLLYYRKYFKKIRSCFYIDKHFTDQVYIFYFCVLLLGFKILNRCQQWQKLNWQKKDTFSIYVSTRPLQALYAFLDESWMRETTPRSGKQRNMY